MKIDSESLTVIEDPSVEEEETQVKAGISVMSSMWQLYVCVCVGCDTRRGG